MGVRRKSTTSNGYRRTTTVNSKKGVTTSTSSGTKGQRTTYSQGPDGRMKKTTTYNTATGYVRKSKVLTKKTTSGRKRKSTNSSGLDIRLKDIPSLLSGLLTGGLFGAVIAFLLYLLLK
jgi:hypothetical protein